MVKPKASALGERSGGRQAPEGRHRRGNEHNPAVFHGLLPARMHSFSSSSFVLESAWATPVRERGRRSRRKCPSEVQSLRARQQLEVEALPEPRSRGRESAPPSRGKAAPTHVGGSEEAFKSRYTYPSLELPARHKPPGAGTMPPRWGSIRVGAQTQGSHPGLYHGAPPGLKTVSFRVFSTLGPNWPLRAGTPVVRFGARAALIESPS
jgi:hypothetical protein